MRPRVRLHRRGYRTQIGEAPLKETLAAAMLAGEGAQVVITSRMRSASSRMASVSTAARTVA